MSESINAGILLFYTRHFSYVDLYSLLSSSTSPDTTFVNFTNITCDHGTFICDMSNSNIFFWFAAISALIFLLKSLVNIRGLGERHHHYSD